MDTTQDIENELLEIQKDHNRLAAIVRRLSRERDEAYAELAELRKAMKPMAQANPTLSPGPYRYNRHSGRICDANLAVVAQVIGNVHCPAANGRLIAAAWEMYDILADWRDGNAMRFDDAKKLLARIEGRQP